MGTVRASNLRFHPLSDGDITVTCTIKKEMVDRMGGTVPTITALAPLMGTVEVQIGTNITQAPKSLAGQLQSVHDALEGIAGGVDNLKEFIDGIRQTELPMEKDGAGKDEQAPEGSKEPQGVQGAKTEEGGTGSATSCYNKKCPYHSFSTCTGDVAPSECVDRKTETPTVEDNGTG